MKMKVNNFFNTALLLFNFIVLVVNAGFSQNEDVIFIEWGEPRSIMYDNKIFNIPTLINQTLDGNKPNFFFRKEVGLNFKANLSLEILSTSDASSIDKSYLNGQYISAGSLSYELSVVSDRSNKSIVLNLFPFIKENGVLKRITSVKIIQSNITNAMQYQPKSFAASSVLKPGSGFWYKISVNTDGIHKIDKAFLESCGIDVDNLNPDHIHIYGNGDGRLPELNSVPRSDDLVNNSIYIKGGADGVFDQDDYILFYAWGPHRWSQSSSVTFNQDRNIYSDISCYFININSTLLPLRILPVSSTVVPATHNVSTYSYHDVHELDALNILGGGQRWYGELFDTEMQRVINFSVPNIDNTTPASFEASIASNAKASSGTSHSYSVNGTIIGSSTLPVASDFGRQVLNMTLPSPASTLPVLITVNRDVPSTLTYLDRIVLNARRQLVFVGTQFRFRDLNSIGAGNVAEFTVQNLPPSQGFIWEVTDRHQPFAVGGTFTGSNYTFRLPTDQLREFVAADGQNYFLPARVGEVAYQNLHELPQADYLIVTHKNFTTQANRLADLHRGLGESVHVVTSEQVFNEFSSGMLDPTAIRMFAKMFYDRGVLTPYSRPQSLLLFGDGTYDPKNRVANNNNYIPTYQMLTSENHIDAMVTDDFFGMLDDNEALNTNDELDIGVGRLLISDTEMARQQVDKVEHYMKNGSALYSTANTNCGSDNGSSTFGDWRTKYVQIADDEEGAYFLDNDVEPQYDSTKANHPGMNCEKIYLDAYKQVSTAGGQRYPDVVDAINDRIERGALVVNYVGHGGEVGVAEERVITVPQIQDWKNIDKLALIVSATCEFTKFDDPDRVSAGEWASINPYGAAIALMTTTRAVYFGVNTNTGKSFFKNIFQRDANDEPKTFGEIIRLSKNGVPGSNNKRSFTLIGDPHLKIALPRMNVVTDSVNGLSPAIEMDTIRALSKVTIKGHIEDFNGSTLIGFNGFLYPSVYDKPKQQQTLGNDATSPIRTFELQTNKLYKGKASVTNGYFEFTFIVPKDINYSFDFGKISYYGENGIIDAIGSDTRMYVGGVDPNGINDDLGPDIDIFLNDENFVSGGITDETPQLLVKIFDENGINAVGNGVGHDLTAIIDGETSDPIVLNDYFTSDLDSYQSGEIKYNFSTIEPGSHTLTVKIWDVNNNSSEKTIDFEVREKQELSLEHVLNYPNPFTTSTEFYFEHNQNCTSLDAQIQILTISGKLVRTINQSVHTEGYRSEGIHWNGRDDFGDQLAKGVYIYRLSVRTPEGDQAEKLEKLVILK
ncbi:MAG: type IX secretion system sortase PorU [Crocinitomicaceae bacterium]